MVYLLLILGFVLLVKGADFFVDGASDIAILLKVPSVIIGLTIVAMGTSAPEAAVSITAGFTGNNDIALGNVTGSNIFNLLFVVGICAFIRNFKVDKDILKRDFLVAIFATLVLAVFILDNKLQLYEGFILLIGIIIYIFSMVKNAMVNRVENSHSKNISVIKSLLYLIIGIISVIVGGNLVVNNAVIIAENLGVSESLIALTIVAIGTSLPELVTSIVASLKGNSAMALGNVVGSNIFNILFILGSSSLLNTINVSKEALIDVIISLILTVIVFLMSKIKKELTKFSGILLILLYLGYTAYIIIR
ncbi:MAG: calcium/sodium antiporter [Lachnospirales bacterium]